jgi:peptidoglycan hydrolase-like protein with peptidoglycan-binding domain
MSLDLEDDQERPQAAASGAAAPGRRTRAGALPMRRHGVPGGPIARRATGEVAPGAEEAIARTRGGGGAPLPDDVRGRFESSLGVDLSPVRVHTGAESAAAASALGARAYATGNDVHFAAGQYRPADPFGLHLIAHEVAHTVQQAPGARAKLEVTAPGDAIEEEADRAADAMVAGRPAEVRAASGVARAIARKPGDPPEPEPEHLESAQLAGDARLEAAYHNSPPLHVNETGDAVAKLQTALADAFDEREVMPKTFASGQADGIYGDETSRAVRDFQTRHNVNPPGGWEAGHKTLGTMDRLLKGKGPQPPQPQPPQPQPPQPQPPQPQPPQPAPPSAELETVLDRIEVAYQNMITRQRDGVQAAVRDLTPLDAPNPSTATTILGGLLKGILTFLYGAGEGVLRMAVVNAMSSQPDTPDNVKVVDNANDKVFDQMWGGAMDFVGQLLGAGPKAAAESRANLLADFADAQLELVTKTGFLALDGFEQSKPTLRAPATAPVPPVGKVPPSADPRVTRARNMLASINTTTGKAFGEHYNTIVERWSRELSRQGPGIKLKTGAFGGGQEQTGFKPKLDGNGKPVIDPDTGEPEQEAVMAAKQSLDLSPLKQGGPLAQPPPLPPGVIGATLLGGFPGQGVLLKDAHVDGLSPRVRTKLKDKTVADAGISVVASGTFQVPVPPDPNLDNFGKQAVTVGINEVGHVFDLTNEFGSDWLEQEGKGDRQAGLDRFAALIKVQKLGDVDAG